MKRNDELADVKEVIRLGDVLDLECISVGAKGDGVFKHCGVVVIVPSANEIGKTYRIKITRVLERMAFGRMEHL